MLEVGRIDFLAAHVLGSDRGRGGDLQGYVVDAVSYTHLSVPGLCAKPIIDIMPVVRDIGAVDGCNAVFVALGYTPMGEFGIPGRRYFHKGGDERTHHVHVFAEENAEAIERHLAVSAYLRAHADEARAYGELKRALAARFPRDWDGYCDGKDEYVRALEARALKWYRTRKG